MTMEAMWLVYSIAACIVWVCIQVIRIRKSPISKIPGPENTKFTAAWLIIQEFTSHRRSYIHKLHQRYGPAVRLGPNEVSFTSVEAVKEIYTVGGSGYDKTELYNLFMQFGFRQVTFQKVQNPTDPNRTMFSTLLKGDVSS
jgi:hypothetical protein